MSELIISVSGLRGVVGETLIPDVAMRYVAAFSAESPEGPFVVTRDGRPSGGLFADAIHAVLNAVGRDTVDAGVAATPTAGVLVRKLRAAGGIQISASHNPSRYNGIKLFSGEGRVIPQDHGARVLDRYKNNEINWVSHDRIGIRSVCDDVIGSHLSKVLGTVDVEAIRNRRFRVLLDSNRGAGSILGKRLLEELGCDIVLLGGCCDGRFEHTPEPTAEHLQPVFEKVKQAEVDVAFCQDPDADRLAIIDRDGCYIGEEYTVALCVEHILLTHAQRGRRKGAIVVNCATSRMTEDIALRYQVPLIRTSVGEANVVDVIMQTDAMFGGEGNGGPIDPHVGWVRDSFVGMAQVLDAMALRGKTPTELADELPKYAIVKQKTTLASEKVGTVLDALESEYAEAPCDRRDGLRIDWPEAWVLIRASNTEPIVRIIAEAKTAEEAERICDDIRQKITAV